MCNFLIGAALSLHVGLAEEYNEVHPNVKVECGNYVSGLYYNSINNFSAYAGFRFDLSENVSTEIGLVDGYDKADTIKPMIKLNYDNYFIMPTYEESSGRGGVVLGYEFFIGD